MTRLSSPNRAGVLLAVRRSFIKNQYLSKHSVPNPLRGFLAHVSLHSPHSRPLHIVGAYCPQMSSPDWGPVQQAIFSHVQGLAAVARRAGSRLFLAGELNVVLHASHRSHGRLLAQDIAFQACLENYELVNCFTGPPTQMPHTCRSEQWSARYSSSRIDHI